MDYPGTFLLQFLAFEVKQAKAAPTDLEGAGQEGPTPCDAAIQRILALMKNAHQFGIDLVLVLRNITSSSAVSGQDTGVGKPVT